MKVILTLSFVVGIVLAFFYGVDREIARQNYLAESKKPVPARVKGCIFYGNCRYYNILLEEKND